MGISKLDDSRDRLATIFKDLGITEKSIDADMAILKEWYDKQAHLPPIPAEFEDEIKLWIQHLLIATKNSIERVKVSIENYMYLRTDFPQLFDEKLIRDTMYNDFYNAVTVITLPKVTPDDRLVFYWSFNHPDPSTFDLIYLVQRFRMVLDHHIQQSTEFFGFHSIADLSNIRIGHLSHLDLFQLKKIMNYATKGYPLRITNLHLINPPSFLEYGYNMITPFLSKKIVSRFLVHKSLSGLLDHIPADVLPNQLGGTGGDLAEMKSDWNKRIESSRRLLDSDVFQVNKAAKLPTQAKKAVGVVTVDELGPSGTFRKLCVD